MTVEELIEILNKIKDKNKELVIGEDYGLIFHIKEEKRFVNVEIEIKPLVDIINEKLDYDPKTEKTLVQVLGIEK